MHQEDIPNHEENGLLFTEFILPSVLTLYSQWCVQNAENIGIISFAFCN